MAEHFKEDDGLFLIPDEIDELGDTADLSAAKAATPDVPRYILPDKAYVILKWFSIILLPVLSWAIGELLPDYGIDPYKAVHALDVLGVVVGGLIGASAISAVGHKGR